MTYGAIALGFTVNVDDSASSPTISGSKILLTNVSPRTVEYRSIFFDTPQSISDFTASFTYQESGGNNSNDASGACFALETTGASAVRTGAFAYGNFPGKSIGLTLQLGSTSSGYYTDGSYAGGSPSTAPVDLLSGDPIDVTLTYNGTTLQESLTDETTDAAYSNIFLIPTPLTTLLGGPTAYVGLIGELFGGSGYDFTTTTVSQYFSNLEYTTSAVPDPSTLALLGLGAIGVLALARRKANPR